jgi:hypothetical protein
MAVKAIKIVFYVFVAGGLGGLTNSMVVWSLGTLGVTPALGFGMTPELTFEWLLRRVFASALWGIIFLIPVYENAPLKKGAVLSILPWLCEWTSDFSAWGSVSVRPYGLFFSPPYGG